MTDTLLRLAIGSHKKGSGKGCAMNVVSWENGDSTITDMPSCADPMLARVVQRVNDKICSHRRGDLMCAPCSVAVLDLAHRTVGTNLLAHGWDPKDIRRVWVRLAIAEAESVQHLAKDQAKAAEYIAMAREWVETGKRPAAYADAAYADADAAYDAAYAAYAYAAAYAAYDADAAYAYAAAYAAYDAAYAAYAAYAAQRLARAHAVIDRFEALTGIKAKPVATEDVALAVSAMCEV